MWVTYGVGNYSSSVSCARRGSNESTLASALALAASTPVLSSLFPWRNNRSRFYRVKNNHQVCFFFNYLEIPLKQTHLLRFVFLCRDGKNVICRHKSGWCNQAYYWSVSFIYICFFHFMTEVFLRSRWKRRLQICLATVNLILEQICQEWTLLTPFYSFFFFFFFVFFTFIYVYFMWLQFCQSVVFTMIWVHLLVCIFFSVALFMFCVSVLISSVTVRTVYN